jgi:hypothetical protein
MNLSYEEKLQRLEELIWLRDEIKALIEEKEYEQTVFDATKTSEATTDSAKAQLECAEGSERKSSEASVCWSDEAGSGGCCEGRKCGIEKTGRCGRIL